MSIEIKDFKWDSNGLLCAIAQDVRTGEVLMQAYMNEQALQATLESGIAHYYSRSRNCLWKKGETSGNVQKLVKLQYDCDSDCVLMQVEQTGAACHTGSRSCFYRTAKEWDFVPDYKVVFDEAKTIAERKINPVEGSYTNYLFSKGAEKICKKIGEEATETVIAACMDNKTQLIGEFADLLYHSMVLIEAKDISIYDVFQEMMARKGLAPNPKYAKDEALQTNRETK